MPIGRYFIFVGSFLLGLLFLSDRYFPEQIAASAHADVDRSVVQIQSRHKWPAAVVYDTSLPTIVPPVLAVGISPERSPRDAFAQLPPAPAARVKAADALPKAVAAKRVAKPRHPVRRVATYLPLEPRGFFQVGW